MRTSIIAAVSQNSVIGKDGEIPWPRLKRDQDRFCRLTKGRIVIVGRKTHESVLRRLRRPLIGCTTVVVTRNPAFKADGCEVVNSLETALDFGRQRGEKEVFVVGGAELYWQTIFRADRLYITIVSIFPPGDAFFPPYPPPPEDAWRKVKEELHLRDDKNPLSCTFVEWEKKGFA